MADQTELALRIELTLRAAPGTVSDIASTLGVHRSTLHRWASGQVEPTTQQVQALAALAGVDPALVHYGPTPVLRSTLPPRLTRAEALRQGGSAAAVAAAAGVHRSTVTRWRNHGR